MLAQLPLADRARLEHHLATASFAVWQARHRLSEAMISQTSAVQWWAYLHTALAALGAADAVMTTFMTPAELER
jgi:hypothetical protein